MNAFKLRSKASRVLQALLALLAFSRRVVTIRLRALVLLGSMLSLGNPYAADWNGYRGDRGRRAYVAENASSELALQWTFLPANPPLPAWPAPARRSYWQQLETITPRVVDDHAFHPVIVGDRGLFSSSSDDHVRCLNLVTGRLAWRYATGGPVRYAPFVSKDRVFFGSDDGFIYCVSLSAGELLWKRRLSERDWRIPGNGRVISSWPVRTGCVVVGDRVFVTSGLFPEQGTWAFSLDVRTGDIGWRVSLGSSPQGYLLAAEDRLFVPTGRGQPLSLDLETGRFLQAMDGLGGTFAVVDGGSLVNGSGNDGTMAMTDVQTGARLTMFKGSQMSVSPRYSILFDGHDVIAMDRAKYREAIGQSKKLREQLRTLQEARRVLATGDLATSDLATSDLAVTENRERQKEVSVALRETEEEQERARKVLGNWPTCSSLIAVGETVIIAHREGLAALEVVTGKVKWEVDTPEAMVSLAWGNGRLVGVSDSGRWYCFGKGSPFDEVRQTVEFSLAERGGEPEQAFDLSRLVETFAINKGFAVLVGEQAAARAEALVSQSQLAVVIVLRNRDQVAVWRDHLLRRGSYGRRIAVIHQAAERLPLTDGFAVLVLGDFAEHDRRELRRISRPHGGIVRDLNDGQQQHRRGQEGEGTWTHLYGNPANTATSGDELIGSELALQWFGGVGPSRMVDRHLRGPSPLYNRGILMVPGENLALGIDAFSGTELWELGLPESQRYSMPYDGGYMAMQDDLVAFAVRRSCWLVNASSGDVVKRIEAPGVRDDQSWGYLAFVGSERLVGSLQSESASRTTPSRDVIDSDYRNEQGNVISETLFALNPTTGQSDWSYSDGVILNPSITLGEGSVFFVGGDSVTGQSRGTGRLSLATLGELRPRLTCLDLQTGERRWQVLMSEALLLCRNILYLASTEAWLVVVGSYLNSDNDTTYVVACYDAATGKQRWENAHEKGRPGETFHGEQVHHPVILGERLIAEPLVYDLLTGRQEVAGDAGEPWRLERPGHSCGTISASQSCLFFRAGNPTVLSLDAHLAGEASPQKLSPTRPGCWINIIPAGGLVLIPEASAGCVCHFSLQTSMAFRPVGHSR